MTGLRYLFMDFNAYFASVEQHDDPSLRGAPLIVTPLKSEHTGAIAASYEARRYGIRRGTPVREARELCPQIIIRQARHDRYVEMHHQLKQEVERHIPITKVYSVDEWVCRLAASESQAAPSIALAENIRVGIARNLSPALRVSIGLAATPLLAKLAAERMKPDGLTLLPPADLPDCLKEIELQDIPGIGRGVACRLKKAGITDFLSLWHLQPKHARKIWGSVEGERFWYRLHGDEVPEVKTKKSTIGHSRVLSRQHETPNAAKIVARALLMKAASRLRHYQLLAAGASLSIRMRGGVERGAHWETSRRFSPSANTFAFIRQLDTMWEEFLYILPRLRDGQGGRRLGGVTVYLHHLTSPGDMRAAQGDLFEPTEKRKKDHRQARLWTVIDHLNADMEGKMGRLGGKAGQRYVTLAAQKDLDLEYLGAKIAFSRVPDENEFLF
ncbi:MAG: Y-family DNA polymerase [bacterium]